MIDDNNKPHGDETRFLDARRFWSHKVKSATPYVPGEQPSERKFIKLNTNDNPYSPSKKGK